VEAPTEPRYVPVWEPERATPEKTGAAIHAYPTLSESVKVAFKSLTDEPTYP
jgi:hypothetical protein